MTSAPPFSRLTHLICPECHTEYDADVLQGLCACGSPLLARYDLDAVRRETSPPEIGTRPPTLWRYHELLPVRDKRRIVSFGEGLTPLTPLPRLASDLGLETCWVKDESPLPTGTFKARGAAVGVSRAVELGVRAVGLPTNGNAGAAWATYAARAGLRCLVAMPNDAPAITTAECVVSGADTYRVRGLIGDAGAMIARTVAASDGRLMDASTLKEPYRVEGKKTIGLEIAEQLGWRMPDVIVYPAGGGVGLIGIAEGLRQLQQLGWVTGELPRMVVVQSTGCAPIVAAYDRGSRAVQAWPDARTIAFGITVPRPLGGPLVIDAVTTTGGTAIAVDDAAILDELHRCARLEGLFMCPEGAATLAAVRALRASSWIDGHDEVVVVNTGTGLISPETVVVDVPLLDLDEPIPSPV